MSHESPLFGLRVVNTRSPRQAPQLDHLLRERGAEPIAYPCIDIAPPADHAPLAEALRRLEAGGFDWLVFTSANAVEAVAAATADSPLPPGWTSKAQVAVVGPGTATALAHLLGVTADLCPAEHQAEALAYQLTARGAQHVLVPQADKAREMLGEVLAASGVEVEAVVAYRTVLGRGGSDVPRLLRAGQIDAVVFASPSAVDNMATRFEGESGQWDDLWSVCVACIGPLTAHAAEERGLRVDVVPKEHTLPALVRDLESFYRTHKQSGGSTP